MIFILGVSYLYLACRWRCYLIFFFVLSRVNTVNLLWRLFKFIVSRSFLLAFILFHIHMSERQEIDSIVNLGGVPVGDSAREALGVAWNEVNRLLDATGDSLAKICSSLEAATSRKGLREVFRRFNAIIRMFTETVPMGTEESLVLETVASFESSRRFKTLLTTLSSVDEAVAAYKKLVLKDLAVLLRQKKQSSRVADKFDDELFDQILPESAAVDTRVADSGLVSHALDSSPLLMAPGRAKRSVSEMAGDPYKSLGLKRSKIPALASLGDIAGDSMTDKAARKRILMTREKLRAASHDPRGLLNLVGSSTNALERTKKLELLKSTGFEFGTDKKLRRSFSEKFNAASLRLDLGLGGHSSEHSLLFGAKVLSIPRYLTNRNISDIENSVVDGNTT